MNRQIKNAIHFLEASGALIINGCPSQKLMLIGVTGTDGKTTTTSLIYHLLRKAGRKAGMISTVGAKINDNDYSVGLHTTTPSSFTIQKLLRKMVAEKCQYAVLEVTSHAIDQYRIAGCRFKIGVLTNITHDHLDYHQTYKNYLETKLRLFKNSQYTVLNIDDSSYNKIIPYLGPQSVITYGINNEADLMARDILQNDNRQTFSIVGAINGHQIAEKLSTSLLGDHNISNNLAAISVCLFLGISDKAISAGIQSFTAVKGRLEVVNKYPFQVIVDFAHTPNAFTQVLGTVRKMTDGKIIHVFGATGDRDKTKRPIMGKISGELADYSIVTSEDTYGEKPEQIIDQIEKGIQETAKKKEINYWKIPDRREAIRKALELAENGDLVLITGVGHQTTLNVGNKEIPWNDGEVVREIIKSKA